MRILAACPLAIALCSLLVATGTPGGWSAWRVFLVSLGVSGMVSVVFTLIVMIVRYTDGDYWG